MVTYFFDHPVLIAITVCATLYLMAIKRQVGNGFIILISLAVIAACGLGIYSIWWQWGVLDIVQKLAQTAFALVVGGFFAIIGLGNVSAIAHTNDPGWTTMPEEYRTKSNGVTGLVLFFVFALMGIAWIWMTGGSRWSVGYGSVCFGVALAALIPVLIIIFGLALGGKK